MLAAIVRAASLLDRRERWQWAALAPLAGVVAALETAGAGAVFLLVRVLADPSYRLPRLLQPFATGSRPSTLAALAALVVAFYVVRAGLLVAVEYVQERVVQRTAARIATGLLNRYLHAPYAFHFHRASASLVQQVSDGSEEIVERVLASVVHMSEEALVVLALLAALAFAAPLATLAAVVAVVALLGAALLLTRGLYARWGREEQALGEQLLARLNQSFDAIKDILVTGREAYFNDRFTADRFTLARLRARRSGASAAIRVGLETVFISGMLIAIVLLAMTSASGPDAVSRLTLFAYAGFRIVPSANRIVLHANLLRWGVAFAQALEADWRRLSPGALEAPREPWPPLARDLVIEDVSYEYEASRGAVLDGVTVRITRGESIGVVGATGAGKSTLIDVVLGLLLPTHGRVLADGRDIRENLRGWQACIGYVAQQVMLIDDTLRRNIAFGLDDREIDDARVARAASQARLDEVIAAMPEGLASRVGERGVRLSGGERQRVAIARALYRDPALLVFDEATSALDHATEREIAAAIDQFRGERTLIVIAHRLSTVRACDRLVLLDRGRVGAVGAYADLQERSALFRALSTAT